MRGVVQGVGFRPFVYRLASANNLQGWVLNAEEGVEIHLEGNGEALQSFLQEMKSHPPQAAQISEVRVASAEPVGATEFVIRESAAGRRPTVRISPDLPVCEQCLQELFDPDDRRRHYPYINCTNCGPRYSIIRSLPYDRPNTTMAAWPLDGHCAADYVNPADRRFHAQPVACPACGPHYFYQAGDQITRGDKAAIRKAVQDLRAGKIVAVKGLGGYHLACDAQDAEAVSAMRAQKIPQRKALRLNGEKYCGRARAWWNSAPKRKHCCSPLPDLSYSRARKPSCPASRPKMTSSASCCPTRRCIICSSLLAPPIPSS